MKKSDHLFFIAFLSLLFSFSATCMGSNGEGSAHESTESIPSFIVDPFWPKPLPNQWLIGQVAGVAVDSRDHIWIVHRPNSLGEDEYAPTQQPESGVPYIPAPPVIEFDAEGNGG